MLFVRPFGPNAFAAWQTEEKASEPEVYGVSDRDVQRLEFLLYSLSKSQRTQRHLQMAGFAATGALAVGMGSLTLARSNDPSFGYPLVVGGGFALGLAAIEATGVFDPNLDTGGGYILYGLAKDVHDSPNDRATAFARAEYRLFRAARTERALRTINAVLASVNGTYFGAAWVANELRPLPDVAVRWGLGAVTIGFTAVAVTSLFPTELERFADAWKMNPERPLRPTATSAFTFTPTLGGFAGTL
jgi:hypothetical protein